MDRHQRWIRWGGVEESSTSRVVREPGVPLKSEEGRKRSLVLLARKRALSSSRPEVAMSFQEEDPSACHCQELRNQAFA